MRKIILTEIILVTSLFALSPFEIASKVKANSDGYGSARTIIEMTLVDQAKNSSKRVMHSISMENKENDGINGDKSLIEFKTPLDVKGTKFLSHEKINKNNNQWLYLPALKRVKRITSKNKSGSFMGSEFSYEDISSRDLSKYTYSKDYKESKLDGIDVYIYERYPKDKDSAYSKQVLYVDKNKFLLYKAQFYDRKKELLKTGIYSGYKKFGNTYRLKKIIMTNHQNKKSTALKYLKDEIHLNLNSKLFSKRYLKD